MSPTSRGRRHHDCRLRIRPRLRPSDLPDAARSRGGRRSVARTSCSRRRPAPARRACSSSATSTCCAPASIRTTSSRSPSRARPRPRCASASSSGCRRAAARASSTRARWRELRDRLGDIAISTIDAFCLSLLREFPLEADVDPGLRAGGRHRGAAADRRGARSGAAHLPRRRRDGRRRGAGVRAARRARSCAPASRRCSTGGSSRRTRCAAFCARARAI